MSREADSAFDFDGEALTGVLVSRRDNARRPCVILFPTVLGVSDLEIGFGRDLVHLGYTAFVADLYGRRFTPGVDRQEAMAAMTRLREDRAALRRRLTAVLDHVRTLDAVQSDAIVAAGYCFGGQCALDLARSGADIAGTASFHGLFDPPGLDPLPIISKVIAFHGWDDPLVRPDQVVALAEEMTTAGADWQLHAYGHTGHGFTNPNAAKAGNPGIAFNAAAAERSWTAFVNFLEDVLG
jgi:dienelactone hydrolase